MPTPKTPTPTVGHGHNSLDRAKLKDIITRIESIEAERTELASDVKDILAEARSSGFDVRAIRQIIRLRRQDATERAERQAVVDSYLEVLGDLVGTPLGDHAITRVVADIMPPV